MALMLISPEVYDRLEKKLGKDEAYGIVTALNTVVEDFLQGTGKKVGDTLGSVQQKADFLISQKKFELKDELSKELATKADLARVEGGLKTDIARLEGEIKIAHAQLDRKFMIMFLVLLFTVIFVNQNALEFIVKIIGLAKP